MCTVAGFGRPWKLILLILGELGGDDSKATSLHTENTSQHILCLTHPRNPAGSALGSKLDSERSFVLGCYTDSNSASACYQNSRIQLLPGTQITGRMKRDI